MNVEVMRYRNGQIMARDEEAAGTRPEVDFVAGVPDSGIPHAIGYSAESKQPFCAPLHQVHAHLVPLVHAERPAHFAIESRI